MHVHIFESDQHLLSGNLGPMCMIDGLLLSIHSTDFVNRYETPTTTKNVFGLSIPSKGSRNRLSTSNNRLSIPKNRLSGKDSLVKIEHATQP